MKKSTNFVCQQCGAVYTKWVGQCNNCKEWNSLVEQVAETETEKKTAIARGQASGKKLNYVNIKTIVPSDAKARLKTKFKDLDTVLGGGFSSRLNQEVRIKRGLALLRGLLPLSEFGIP